MDSDDKNPPSAAERIPEGVVRDSEHRRGASFFHRANTVKLQIGQTDLGSLSIIDSVPEHRRVVVEIKGVSAHVPNFIPGASTWRSKLNPFAGWRKAAPAADGAKPAMRQVMISGIGVLFGLGMCEVP
jgi:hypothetical protein